jgi:hypothetical protein
VITPALDLLFNGKDTVEEAVQKMAPQINRMLQEKR